MSNPDVIAKLIEKWRAEEARYQRLAAAQAPMGGSLYVSYHAQWLLAKRYADELRDALALLTAVRPETDEVVGALRELYDLLPDVDDDYLLDGNKGEFALKAIHVPGIGRACARARAALVAQEAEQPEPDSLYVGDVVAIDGRRVRVVATRDGATVARDHRQRIAVRNVDTNRLSYIPERRLLKLKPAPLPSAQEKAAVTAPDAPHVNPDFAECWQSGWRAGYRSSSPLQTRQARSSSSQTEKSKEEVIRDGEA